MLHDLKIQSPGRERPYYQHPEARIDLMLIRPFEVIILDNYATYASLILTHPRDVAIFVLGTRVGSEGRADVTVQCTFGKFPLMTICIYFTTKNEIFCKIFGIFH